MVCDPPFQVHVTLVPATIVSTAGFWLPLRALRKKISPTVTWPTAPPPPGEVTPPHAASEKRTVATIRVAYRTLQPPSKVMGLAVDQVVQHHQVRRAARADVIDVGAQRAGAERNPDPGDDRVDERDPDKGKPAFVGPNRCVVRAQARAVLPKQLNRGLAGQIHVAEHDAKAAHQRWRRLAGNPKQLVELVAAYGREDLAGGDDEVCSRVGLLDIAR